MTQAQVKQLERATAIASRDALEVAGKGKTKDGRTVYAVPSRSQAGRWHLVAVFSGALVCDCQAAKYGRICAHRAAVRVRLEAERLERLAATAVKPEVRGVNDTRPFSIFAPERPRGSVAISREQW